MSVASRAYRNACRLLVIAAIAAPGCRSSDTPVPIDLLRELPHATRRAAGGAATLDERVRVDVVTIGGSTRNALVTVAPARVSWPVQLIASDTVLRMAIALRPAPGDSSGVVARIGVSDNRFYDELIRVPLAARPGEVPAWQPLELDLSAYSGWRFSLFYQPYRRTWTLIFNADASPRGAVAWAEPMIAARR